MNSRGFTLIEMMIAMSVFLIVVIGVQSGMTYQMTSLETLTKTYSDDLENPLLILRLQKALSSSIKVFGFTGDAGTNTALVRIPYKNRCSDLNNNNACNGQTAFLTASVKKPFAGLSVVCTLPAPANRLNLVLNLTDTPAVDYTVNGSLVRVRIRGQDISEVDLSTSTMVAALTSTHGLALRPAGTLQTFNPRYNPVTKRYQDAQFAANPECIQFSNPTDSLYTIQVSSFRIPGTGNANATSTRLTNEMGKMPLLLVNLELYSTGWMPGDIGTVNKCIPNSSALQLDCSEQFFSTNNIKAIDFVQALNQPLDAGAIVQSFGFHATSCASMPDCIQMPYTNPIPYQTINEAPDDLDSGNFSLMKQEYMGNLIVRFKREQIIQGQSRILTRDYYVSLL